MSVALTLLTASAASAAPVRVGIAVQLSVNLDEGARTRVVEGLEEAVRAKLGRDVIAGAEVKRRLPGGEVPKQCVADAACLRDLGARLSADELVLVVLVRLGERIQLDPTWVDASTGRAAPRPAINLPFDDPEGQQVILLDAIDALFPGATPSPPASTATSSVSPPSRLAITETSTLGVGLSAASPSPTAAVPLPVWIVGGVSAATLLTGAGLGISSLAQRGGLDADGCRQEQCEVARVDRLARTARATEVLLGVGAALAGVTVAMYALWPEAGDGGLGITGAVGPDGDAWIGLSGRL